jgi:NodT family efflux transporter outer membrane factor (OMF) lipoprotein
MNVKGLRNMHEHSSVRHQPSRLLGYSVAAVACVITMVIISGCAVGPDYKKPKIAMPQQYRPATTQVSTTQPSMVQWWRTFDDPMLDALILDASKNGLDVQAAEARIRTARALRSAAAAGYFPVANATGSYQRSHSGGSGFVSTPGGGGIVSTGGSTRDLYQAGFDASWELDVFGGVRRSVEAATAQEDAAVADYQNVLITLYGEVARNYVELRGFQREVMIAEDNARAQSETLELTRTRYRAGLTSDLDVARAEAQVASTLSDIPLIQTQAAAAAHRLGVLTGQEPTALLDQLAEPQRIPNAPPQVPVGIPSELLRRRPDVRFAERNLAAANATIGAFTADLFPRFTLTGDVGYRSGQFGSMLNSNNLFWGFGPGVSWNIFSAGRTRANIRAQEARTDEALAVYKLTILTALEEVQNALVAYQNDQTRTRALASSVAANQRAVSLAQQLYQRGLADFLNVLQAQLSLFIAQDQLVRSYATVSTDVVQLYKALGGGWEEAPTGATRPIPGPTTAPVPWITEEQDLPTRLPNTESPMDVIEPAPRPAIQTAPAGSRPVAPVPATRATKPASRP